MIVNVSSEEFALMKRYIEDKCGILLSDDKAYLIESRLSKLLIDFKCNTFEQFYKLIYNNQNEYITEKVIDAITTNETLWFRDKKSWEVLENVLMPQYVNMLRENKKNKVRIWSAGCSTGQEPYTMAMIIDNYLSKNNILDVSTSQFEIIATDISGAIIEIAKSARYDAISIMRGLPEFYKAKYFQKKGRVYILNDNIKEMVKFYRFNLQRSFVFLGNFDLIYCRYVMIYFSDNLKNDILKRIALALKENGKFFLGSSEIYFNYNECYDKKNYMGSVYYEVKR
ncbi:protein-glutamate O-methyltransferase CheR [Clostridium aestuarii]|uniref:protein-glutamate O-methyltransferase n=1 Tax=Clostridium aestuarii TaxID=338193 RepID=A0ABT4CX03_9CLOT|nr:protein-glutamate O-methyltransferase CheR [Clostridium aestuarii]MCY6482872.1 protein-glutamate O-methyltransferase CheR [Clostridium aestuarii]